MYNWSTSYKRSSRNDPEYEKWELEQMINFGLNGRKISHKKLTKYWDDISIDPKKREYLEFLLNTK